MKDFINGIARIVGYIVGGYVITKAIKFFAIVSIGLLAIWLITRPFLAEIESNKFIQHERIMAAHQKAQDDFERQFKFNQQQFEHKTKLRQDINLTIQSATTQKELVEAQVEARKLELTREVSEIEARLLKLQATELKRLENLKNIPITIERLTGGNLTNVYWLRNDTTGVLYKTVNGCGGGTVSYANLARSAVALLGLNDDVETFARNEASYKTYKEEQKQIAYEQAKAQYQAQFETPQSIQSYQNHIRQGGNLASYQQFNRRYGNNR